MKKLSLILASALLLGGISFASPLVKKQAQKAPVSKPAAKPATKPASKPAAKPVAKPANHAKKAAPVKKA